MCVGCNSLDLSIVASPTRSFPSLPRRQPSPTLDPFRRPQPHERAAARQEHEAAANTFAGTTSAYLHRVRRPHQRLEQRPHTRRQSHGCPQRRTPANTGPTLDEKRPHVAFVKQPGLTLIPPSLQSLVTHPDPSIRAPGLHDPLSLLHEPSLLRPRRSSRLRPCAFSTPSTAATARPVRPRPSPTTCRAADETAAPWCRCAQRWLSCAPTAAAAAVRPSAADGLR